MDLFRPFSGGTMKTLELAIERQDWRVAAVCLLRGLVQASSSLQPETLRDLLETLEGENGATER